MNARRLLPALTVLATACGAELSNRFLDDDGLFLDAVPRRADLRLSAPQEAAATGAAFGTLRRGLNEEQAEWYVVTRRTTLDIDHTVFTHLRDVERVVEWPPTTREADRRIWGPFSHPLDPLESRFVMQRAEAGLFSYALEKRPAGAEEWSAVVSGSYESAGGPRQGGGSLTFDLDASAQLSGTPARGLVVVDYELAPGRAELALRLVGFAEEAGAAPQDAVFDYRRSPEGGQFEFGFPSEEGGWVEVRSRWRPDGAGRADGRVLGEDTLLFSECWDERFVRTWHAWTRAPEEPAGEPEACVFGELELPAHVAAPEGGEGG